MSLADQRLDASDLECKHDCPGKPAGCTVKFNRFSELTTHVCTQTKFNDEYGEKLRALKDWATERSRYEVKIVLEEHRAQMLAKAKDYLSNTEVLRLIVKLLYPTAPFDLTTKVRNMLPGMSKPQHNPFLPSFPLFHQQCLFTHV